VRKRSVSSISLLCESLATATNVCTESGASGTNTSTSIGGEMNAIFFPIQVYKRRLNKDKAPGKYQAQKNLDAISLGRN